MSKFTSEEIKQAETQLAEQATQLAEALCQSFAEAEIDPAVAGAACFMIGEAIAQRAKEAYESQGFSSAEEALNALDASLASKH